VEGKVRSVGDPTFEDGVPRIFTAIACLREGARARERHTERKD
jgi:hypothetical protein